MEARVARREEARARDGSPDTANLPGGGDAMGLGGDDSFAAAKQRRVPAAHLSAPRSACRHSLVMLEQCRAPPGSVNSSFILNCLQSTGTMA